MYVLSREPDTGVRFWEQVVNAGNGSVLTGIDLGPRVFELRFLPIIFIFSVHGTIELSCKDA